MVKAVNVVLVVRIQRLNRSTRTWTHTIEKKTPDFKAAEHLLAEQHGAWSNPTLDEVCAVFPTAFKRTEYARYAFFFHRSTRSLSFAATFARSFTRFDFAWRHDTVTKCRKGCCGADEDFMLSIFHLLPVFTVSAFLNNKKWWKYDNRGWDSLTDY